MNAKNKANEILQMSEFPYTRPQCDAVFEQLLQMHEWTAKQAEEAFCELCQTKGLRGCNGIGCDNFKLFKSKME